jgi:hypothetical protein
LPPHTLKVLPIVILATVRFLPAKELPTTPKRCVAAYPDASVELITVADAKLFVTAFGECCSPTSKMYSSIPPSLAAPRYRNSSTGTARTASKKGDQDCSEGTRRQRNGSGNRSRQGNLRSQGGNQPFYNIGPTEGTVFGPNGTTPIMAN